MPHAKVLALLVIVGTVALAGCQTTGPKQVSGALLGAATGGLVGSQVGSGRGQLVGMAVGTLAGALLGTEIGASLDHADRAMAYSNAGDATQPQRSEQAMHWSNPDDTPTMQPAGTWVVVD